MTRKDGSKMGIVTEISNEHFLMKHFDLNSNLVDGGVNGK